MIVFDVRCEVLDPVHVTDSSGRDVVIGVGSYRLQGVEHLVHGIGDRMTSTGTDISFVTEKDGRVAYTVKADKLAEFIALDEVEIKP